MSTKVKIVLWVSSVIVLLILVAGYFYWFQWRPNKIHKDCTYRIYNGTQYPNDDNEYKTCIHGKGL